MEMKSQMLDSVDLEKCYSNGEDPFINYFGGILILSFPIPDSVAAGASRDLPLLRLSKYSDFQTFFFVRFFPSLVT